MQLVDDSSCQDAPGQLRSALDHGAHDAPGCEQRSPAVGSMRPSAEGGARSTSTPRSTNWSSLEDGASVVQRTHVGTSRAVCTRRDASGTRSLRVEDDAKRAVAGGVADGEARVVRQRRADADDDGVVLRAQRVNASAGLGSGDPLGGSCA
jgi:hypothetical protein